MLEFLTKLLDVGGWQARHDDERSARDERDEWRSALDANTEAMKSQTTLMQMFLAQTRSNQ